MNLIKRNIIFSLENRKKDNIQIVENVPIRMRVLFLGNRVEFFTGYRIDASKWDSKKQRVKNGCTNKLKQSAADINADLHRYEYQIQNIFKQFEIQNITPTKELLKQAFKNLDKKEDIPLENTETRIDFFTAFDTFTKDVGRQNNWTKATFLKFDNVRKLVYEFNPFLTFDYFDERGLNDYLIFLRDVRKMRNTTIAKQLSYIKWFYRWLKKNELTTNFAFETYKPKFRQVQKKIVFLTAAELKQLADFKIPDSKRYLEQVRDVFLFCCYSGLRYSDVRNLKHSNIKEEHIEITTVKTGDSLIIELNNYTKDIVKKYKNFTFENDLVLPVISNQKMNDYLKELGELAGINDPIIETYYKGNERIETVTPKYALLGSHAGRRTFICFALSLGIPVQIVMKWTGHSDYKSMKPYIDVADSIKATAMAKFNSI